MFIKAVLDLLGHMHPKPGSKTTSSACITQSFLWTVTYKWPHCVVKKAVPDLLGHMHAKLGSMAYLQYTSPNLSGGQSEINDPTVFYKSNPTLIGTHANRARLWDSPPVQVSPDRPGGQLHINDPTVFTQVPPNLQGLLRHSFTSEAEM